MSMFYLGTHRASWIGRTAVPLFVSYRQLAARRSLPRAIGPWALDSGGFSEISLHGRWLTSARDYAHDVRRFISEIGSLDWAAAQDWMCEPIMLEKTGLRVEEHQARTVANYLELRELAPEVPWMPVLQGWTLGDYLDCVEAYMRASVDLRALPIVGVGSVCRRQHTASAEHIIRWISSEGIRLHGFGFKTEGLRRVDDVLSSSDSLSWSFNARKNSPMIGHAHKSCANCLSFALDWRARLIGELERTSRFRAAQMPLFAVSS